MNRHIPTNWEVPLFVIAAGATGGVLSWIYAMTIGQPPATSGIWTLFAWMAFGMAAAYLGVYLIANTDTSVLSRCLAFALLCGFSWKPTLEAADALYQKHTADRRIQKLSGLNEQTRVLLAEAKQVPNDQFSSHAQALVEKGRELVLQYLQVDDYNSRASAALTTHHIVDLLVARTAAGGDEVHDAIDALSESAATLGDLSLAKYAQDAQSGRIQWNLASAFPTDLPALGDNVTYLVDILKTASRGRVALSVLEPGELVTPGDITEAVVEKTIELGYTSLQYDADRIPSATLLSTRPFGMEPWEFTSWWYDGGGKEIGETLYAPHQIKPILCGVTGPETGGWFNKDINTIDDLQGLKMGFFGIGAKVFEKFGVSVQYIPGSEIYQALQEGVIDAAGYSTPATDNALGFHEVAKYNYFPGWQGTSSAFHLVVNSELWERLDSATHALIETACTAAVARNLSHSEAIQGSALEALEKSKVEVKKYSRSVLTQFRSASEKLFTEQATKDAMFRRALESQRKFSDSYHLWKETGYLPHRGE